MSNLHIRRAWFHLLATSAHLGSIFHPRSLSIYSTYHSNVITFITALYIPYKSSSKSFEVVLWYEKEFYLITESKNLKSTFRIFQMIMLFGMVIKLATDDGIVQYTIQIIFLDYHIDKAFFHNTAEKIFIFNPKLHSFLLECITMNQIIVPSDFLIFD